MGILSRNPASTARSYLFAGSSRQILLAEVVRDHYPHKQETRDITRIQNERFATKEARLVQKEFVGDLLGTIIATLEESRNINLVLSHCREWKPFVDYRPAHRL